MQPIPDMIEALGTTFVSMFSSRARRTRSVCVVALWDWVSWAFVSGVLGMSYPNGSPTTKKTISALSAPARMSSLPVSTSSLSASMTGRP